MSWARQNLFSGWGNTLTTVLIGFVLVWALVPFLDWAVFSADWAVSYTHLTLPTIYSV